MPRRNRHGRPRWRQQGRRCVRLMRELQRQRLGLPSPVRPVAEAVAQLEDTQAERGLCHEEADMTDTAPRPDAQERRAAIRRRGVLTRWARLLLRAVFGTRRTEEERACL